MGHRTPGLLHLHVSEPASICRSLPQLCKLVPLIDQSLYEGGYLISNGEESEGGRAVKTKERERRSSWIAM